MLCFSERSLGELEGKLSDLRRELVTVKEELSHVTLQKEVLEEDKASLAVALSKVDSLLCCVFPQQSNLVFKVYSSAGIPECCAGDSPHQTAASRGCSK